METDFVGRAPELVALRAELDSAAATRSLRIVVLTGAAGAGKTRLAAEFAQRCGVVTLWAQAAPFGETDPLGVWAQALDGHLRGCDDHEVRRLGGGTLEDLAFLLRRAAVLVAPPELAPRPRRLYEAIATVLWQLARTAPIVVVLDDVHCADPSTWEALHYLAHGLRDAPVLVLATARLDDLAARAGARTVLWGLEQEGRAMRQPVGPMDAADLRALAAVTTGAEHEALVAWVAQRSRGNALLAVDLLRALLAENADLAAPRLRRLPEDLAARVAVRLTELGERPREIVERLAVFGRSADPPTLRALLGQAGPDLDALFAGLEETGLVLEHDGVVSLGHPLLGDAVRQQLPPASLRLMHRQVGRALLAAGRAGEAAAHFAEASAGRPDDETVDAFCVALARRP